MIKEGDIILRHGYGFVSNMIVKTLAEDIPLSHVGIIAKNSEGKHIVVHSVSQTISDHDGLQEQDLTGFVRDSQPNSIIIIRHIRYESDSDAGKKISDQALHYLQQKIPFDYSFDFESQDRFFCTELIGRVIFDALGDEIYSAEYLSGLSDLEKLKFNVFFDPERFTVVLNHQNRNLN